ncbi:hypothetical protein ABZ605_18225 [Streptomyces sp. NPDC012765]|uniref:hypothetical protein n=1 Tax=Streptomyces sp. NPDC012765 TaxID=3155249 RepID=UPI0033D4D854
MGTFHGAGTSWVGCPAGQQVTGGEGFSEDTEFIQSTVENNGWRATVANVSAGFQQVAAFAVCTGSQGLAGALEATSRAECPDHVGAQASGVVAIWPGTTIEATVPVRVHPYARPPRRSGAEPSAMHGGSCVWPPLLCIRPFQA